MEAPVNPLMLTLQSNPQTGGLISSVQPQAVELEGQNEFLAALQLMLGTPPQPPPVAFDTTLLATEKRAESTLEGAELPAIIAAQTTIDRQAIAGEVALPRFSKPSTAVASGQGVKPLSASSVTPSMAPLIEGEAAVEEIMPVTTDPEQDLPSANSLRLLTTAPTAPTAVNADVPGAALDIASRELTPGQVTQLSSANLNITSTEGQLVRTSVATPMPQTPGQAGWDNALGQRILWMTGQQVKEATIQLNPPELGQILVRVSVDGDQASVNFVSQYANVREAIDAALPRLREMLSADGLNLADASVNDQRQASPDRHSAERPDNRWVAEDDSHLPAAEAQPAQGGIITQGLVDTYV